MAKSDGVVRKGIGGPIIGRVVEQEYHCDTGEVEAVLSIDPEVAKTLGLGDGQSIRVRFELQ